MQLDPDIRDQLASLVEDEGLELLEAEVVGHGPKTILRLVVDAPAGVTLDQCAAVSRQASAMLDVADPIAHRYTLEVTSPGIERKFYSEGDYRRFAGHRVKVRMQPGYREHRVVVGELLGLEGDLVRVMTDGGDAVELPLGSIFETRLQVDWNALMSERKCRL